METQPPIPESKIYHFSSKTFLLKSPVRSYNCIRNMKTSRILIEILNDKEENKMTAASALKYYEMRSTAKQTRSLGQRFMDYLNDNVVYFASANAMMSGSVYGFTKYVLPALQANK